MAHHGYSLNFQLPEGEPLSAFLLSSKAAHCQYFASAAVVLLRCLRVPSRYVSGYYAHESAGPDRIVVRMRDAHAWCESWIDGVGWVTVDATPGGGRPDSFNPPVPAWRRWSEWAQDQSQVIGYRIAHSSPGERAGILAALALLFFSPRLLRLRGKKTRAYCQSTYQQIGRDLRPVAQRFERLLRQQGCPCPTGQTWGEHLSFLDMKGLFDNTLDEKEQARAFVEIYNRARFGAPPTSGELQDIETRLTRLENELRFARRQVNQQKPNT